MKLPEIKKPDIKMPKLKKPTLNFKLNEATMLRLWTGGSIICVACSGIALVVAIF